MKFIDLYNILGINQKIEIKRICGYNFDGEIIYLGFKNSLDKNIFQEISQDYVDMIYTDEEYKILKIIITGK